MAQAVALLLSVEKKGCCPWRHVKYSVVNDLVRMIYDMLGDHITGYLEGKLRINMFVA